MIDRLEPYRVTRQATTGLWGPRKKTMWLTPAFAQYVVTTTGTLTKKGSEWVKR